MPVTLPLFVSLFTTAPSSVVKMLRSFASKDRAGKLKKPSKRSFKDDAKVKLMEQLNKPLSPPTAEYVLGHFPFV